MAQSAHAFVRGSTVRFYEWLQEHGERQIPQGPAVWICGDCHVGNIGPLADLKGRIHIQIRDLDQTVIGNPNHDLIRLALSLASAARGSNLPGVTTAEMLEHMTAGYEASFRNADGEQEPEIARPDSIGVVMRRAMKRTWKHLSRERLSNLKPTIPLGRRFWRLSEREMRAVYALFSEEDVHRLVTALKARDDDSRIEVCDAAYWMKGCSSLGRLRIAVLLRVSGHDRDDEYCLVDVKEAAPAAAPRVIHAPMPRDNARRIVTGARQLAPALGDRMIAARVLGRSVVLRELMPQDLKIDIDQLSRGEAVNSARFLAAVVGKAHARQMDSATRREFLRTLAAQSSSRLDAPSWLWSSVVQLAAVHEMAYLEHCRAYALSQRLPVAS